MRITLICVACLLLLVAAGCRSAVVGEDKMGTSSFETAEFNVESQSVSSVNTEALTQEFLEWAKDYYGFNLEEPAPVATYHGEKAVDGEIWYLISYDVSFMREETSMHLVTADLTRIYQKQAQGEGDWYGGEPGTWYYGKDVFNEVVDPIVESAEAEDQTILEKMFLLAMEEYGKNDASFTMQRISIVQGKSCWVGELLDQKDFESKVLATYALTLDGKQLYRLGDDHMYYLVKELE